MKAFKTVVSLLMVLGLGVVAASTLWAEGAQIPMMKRVEPLAAEAGKVVVAFGEALDKTKVAAVYLTSEGKQIEVEVVEQSESKISFQLPEKMAAGKYNPAVLMQKEAMILVQPVIVVVK